MSNMDPKGPWASWLLLLNFSEVTPLYQFTPNVNNLLFSSLSLCYRSLPSLSLPIFLCLPLIITSKGSSCSHNERVGNELWVISPLFRCTHTHTHTQTEALLIASCSQHLYSLHTLSRVDGWVTQMGYRISCVGVAVSLCLNMCYFILCIYSISSRWTVEPRGKEWSLSDKESKNRKE